MSTKPSESLNKLYKYIKHLPDEELDIAYDMLTSKLGSISEHNKKIKVLFDIIAVEFDNVIINNTNTLENAEVIGTPITGSFQWLEKLVYTENFEVFIYSTRCGYKGFKENCIKWFVKNGCPEDIVAKLNFVSEKLPASIFIGPRNYFFNGNYPSVEIIKDFIEANK
jgi:hypothetical protein